MQRPEGETFPTAFQAVLLYVALLLCELFVGAALRDTRGWTQLSPDQISALTLVLANGCVFVVVMRFQDISWRSLFHHSPASRRAASCGSMRAGRRSWGRRFSSARRT